MATDTDIFCSAPGNTGDGSWYRSGTIYWYDALATLSDSKSARINNYDNSGDDGRTFVSFGLGSIPTYVVINSLTWYAWASRTGTGAGTMKVGWNLSGGALSWGADFTPAGSYYSGSAARPGGGSWSRADLVNLGMRIYGNGNASTAGREIFVDQLFMRVNWDYITLLSLTASAATSITGSSATLPCSYNANGDGDTEWRIMYKPSGGSYDDPGWTASSNTGSNSVSRNLSSLTGGTTYYYKLQARNSANTVQESSEASFTTTASTGGLILFF